MLMRLDVKLKDVEKGDVLVDGAIPEIPNETKTEIAKALIEKLLPHMEDKDWMLHVEVRVSVGSIQMHFDAKGDDNADATVQPDATKQTSDINTRRQVR